MKRHTEADASEEDEQEESSAAILVWQRWVCSSWEAGLADGTSDVDFGSALSWT